MNYRRLGKSGLRVSELSYGSWVTFSFQLDKQKAKKAMKHAYDSGINFFDNAASSSKFPQICPDGLFGEFKKSKYF